jgi:hypothetical protein
MTPEDSGRPVDPISHSSSVDEVEEEDEEVVREGVEAVERVKLVGVAEVDESSDTEDVIEKREPGSRAAAAAAAKCGGNAANGLDRSAPEETSMGTAVRMISTSVMSTSAEGTAIVSGFLRFEGDRADDEEDSWLERSVFASAMRSIADWSTSERTRSLVRLAWIA